MQCKHISIGFSGQQKLHIYVSHCPLVCQAPPLVSYAPGVPSQGKVPLWELGLLRGLLSLQVSPLDLTSRCAGDRHPAKTLAHGGHLGNVYLRNCRHASFYCIANYCASQMLRVCFYKLKARFSNSKKYYDLFYCNTCFITIKKQRAISPKSACRNKIHWAPTCGSSHDD